MKPLFDQTYQTKSRLILSPLFHLIANFILASAAIFHDRLLAKLLPEPAVDDLVIFMLLQSSRRSDRMDAHGDLISLEQKRSLLD